MPPQNSESSKKPATEGTSSAARPKSGPAPAKSGSGRAPASESQARREAEAADAEDIADDTQFSKLSGTAGAENLLDDLQGRQIGEFQLLRRLGRGGMAEVYLAEQVSLRRNVAVKVLRADMLGGDDVLIKRFEQEAKAAGSLNHPNIIQVYAIGADAGIHYIAQEYVQGMNLREFLTKRGVPDLPVAVHIMRQTAAALEAAAEAGIVHRDIKPENIMITKKGKVKVGDFGLAQLTLGEERVNLTQVGMTMGTPLYMSPEQVNGNKVDQRSDIYSFGVTCYHMLTGQPPFRGPTAMSIAVKHLKEEPAPLQERRPDLPAALCQMVHRMMAKDPAQRYASAQALSNDLKKLAKLVKEQPDAAAEMSLSEAASVSGGVRGPSWGARHPLAAFILLSLLAGSASAGVGWLMRPRNPLDAPITTQSKFPKKGNASDQFLMAKLDFAGDEGAWQAVIDNFPSDKHWTQRARVQLGLLYLRNRRWSEAERIFRELSTADDDEVKASGIAGKAILETLRGQNEVSQSTIANELQPLRQKIPPEVARLVQDAIARNRQVLGDKVAKGYEDLFHGSGE